MANSAPTATNMTDFLQDIAHLPYDQRIANVQSLYESKQIDLNTMENLKAQIAMRHNPLTNQVFVDVLSSQPDPAIPKETDKFLKDPAGEADGFAKVNRRRKAKSVPDSKDKEKRQRKGNESNRNPIEVTTANPFDVLSDKEDMDAENSQANASNNNKTDKPKEWEGKIPPIFFLPESNWQEVLDKLALATSCEPKAILTGEHIKLSCATAEEYRKCISFLESSNLQFHTFSLGADRPLKSQLPRSSRSALLHVIQWENFPS